MALPLLLLALALLNTC
jgi:hypothetical protein